MAKAEVKTEDLKEYVLKAGYEHNGFDENGERHLYVGGQKDNDRVMLSEAQAKSLADRFESVAEMKERLSLQNEVNLLREKQAKVDAALQEKGMTLDDLLNSMETIKKPDIPKEEVNQGVAPQGGPSQNPAPAKK